MKIVIDSNIFAVSARKKQDERQMIDRLLRTDPLLPLEKFRLATSAFHAPHEWDVLLEPEFEAME